MGGGSYKDDQHLTAAFPGAGTCLGQPVAPSSARLPIVAEPLSRPPQPSYMPLAESLMDYSSSFQDVGMSPVNHPQLCSPGFHLGETQSLTGAHTSGQMTMH